MGQVTVNVAGKAYRMACNDGEEKHLAALAAALDAKIDELRGSFGEIGDMRLHVMAAIFFADEASELKRRLDRIEGEITALQLDAEKRDARVGAIVTQLAQSLDAAAERVEGMTKRLR